MAGRPRGLREPLHRVLVMNRAGGRVADVALDYAAFPDEGPTVWIEPGMASVIEDQCHGEFWAEAARITGSTGPNGKGWTGRTRDAILTFLRHQDALVRSASEARTKRPWTVEDVAAVCEAAGLPVDDPAAVPDAAIVAAHLRARRTR